MQKFLLSTFITVILCSPMISSAQKNHRHHHAHVHGEAELSLAIEGTSGELEFKSPAEAIVGFEHLPKNEKQKKILADVEASFRSSGDLFLKFPLDQGCKLELGQFDFDAEGKHADVKAKYVLKCLKPFVAGDLQLDLSQFKRLRRLQFTVLTEQGQSSFHIKKFPTIVTVPSK